MLSEEPTSYGRGETVAPWTLVWVCAHAASRIAAGVPVVVLLFLPGAVAWFDRGK